MKVLVINSGSSSVKAQLMETSTGEVLAKSEVLAAVVYLAAAKHNAPSPTRAAPRKRKIFQSFFQFPRKLPQLLPLTIKVTGKRAAAQQRFLSQALHHSSRLVTPSQLNIRRLTG